MDAGPFVIGLLGAVPFIAQLAQLPAIVVIEHVRRRKVIAISAVTVARISLARAPTSSSEPPVTPTAQA